MASHNLTDHDALVFKKLKEISEKKNPSWASVTNGIFLCNNCSSAVHRSLSVQIPEASTGVSSSDALKEELLPEHVTTSATSSTKASSTVVPSGTFKKPLGAIRLGKTGRLGAQNLTTKGDLYDQKPDIFVHVIPASSSTNNRRSKSSPGSSSASQVECKDHLRSVGQSGAGTRVLSHGAPPKPPSSSSSSIAQIEETEKARKKLSYNIPISFAEHLDKLPPTPEVKKEFWPLVCEFGCKIKEKLIGGVLGADVYGLRRETTKLMEILHGEDAHTIPVNTRQQWVSDALYQARRVPRDIFRFPIYGPMVASVNKDLVALLHES